MVEYNDLPQSNKNFQPNLEMINLPQGQGSQITPVSDNMIYNVSFDTMIYNNTTDTMEYNS